jgi:hypothetical protein
MFVTGDRAVPTGAVLDQAGDRGHHVGHQRGNRVFDGVDALLTTSATGDAVDPSRPGCRSPGTVLRTAACVTLDTIGSASVTPLARRGSRMLATGLAPPSQAAEQAADQAVVAQQAADETVVAEHAIVRERRRASRLHRSRR